MPGRYRHILFDLDGTLYDTYFANEDSLKEVFAREFPERPWVPAEFDAVFGIPGPAGLKILGVPEDRISEIMDKWEEGCVARGYSVKLFPDVLPVLQWLKEQGCHLAIVTSRKRNSRFEGTLAECLPPELVPYMERAVSSSDVKRPKPYPDSILHYMQLTGAKPEEILFVGDTATDLQCADSAGVDFALAQWGCKERRHMRCAHYLMNPFDLLNIQTAQPPRSTVFALIRELQGIAQAGLFYTKDRFDKERFERLSQISQSLASIVSGEDNLEKIKAAFCFERGYLTPKMDTRAAIFNDRGEILLVQERNSGLWNMPGGWCDEDLTLVKNTVKEVREEAGLEVNVSRLIAIVDRNAHNTPPLPFGCLKAFLMCQYKDAPFVPNDETLQRQWFARDKLPVKELRLDTNTYEQLMMCFAAYDNAHFVPVLE